MATRDPFDEDNLIGLNKARSMRDETSNPETVSSYSKEFNNILEGVYGATRILEERLRELEIRIAPVSRTLDKEKTSAKMAQDIRPMSPSILGNDLSSHTDKIDSLRSRVENMIDNLHI